MDRKNEDFPAKRGILESFRRNHGGADFGTGRVYDLIA